VAITLEQLVRTAMRLRPDRLVVGEVRGPEVLALVQALNTGHDGSWSTCHANSALDALRRLETLVLQAAPSWPLRAARHHLGRSIDAVVHVARTGRSARRVAEVAEVVLASDDVTLCPLTDGDRVVGALTRGRA
jgi:pilus assembly protein CpaF